MRRSPCCNWSRRLLLTHNASVRAARNVRVKRMRQYFADVKSVDAVVMELADAGPDLDVQPAQLDQAKPAGTGGPRDFHDGRNQRFRRFGDGAESELPAAHETIRYCGFLGFGAEHPGSRPDGLHEKLSFAGAFPVKRPLERGFSARLGSARKPVILFASSDTLGAG